MVNFTKLAVVAFAAVVTAKPVETGVELLEKRQSAHEETSVHWPSIQTCYDVICKNIDNGFYSRCDSILKCQKAHDHCSGWYCDRVRQTKFIISP